MVQVSPEHSIIDLSIKGLSPGRYFVSVRENGDISKGAVSTGGVWKEGDDVRGDFGEVEVGEDGTGSAFLERKVAIWELIGRSFVVSKKREGWAENEKDTVCGVIARSAGVWQNEKTVGSSLISFAGHSGGSGYGAGLLGAWCMMVFLASFL
jgi:copper chaperone for superoxide dismutase